MTTPDLPPLPVPLYDVRGPRLTANRIQQRRCASTDEACAVPQRWQARATRVGDRPLRRGQHWSVLMESEASGAEQFDAADRAPSAPNRRSNSHDHT